MITTIQFTLFCKLNSLQLTQNISSYIQQHHLNRTLLHPFSEEFLLFLSNQSNIDSLELFHQQLHLFLQTHSKTLTIDLLNDYRTCFEQAIIRLLFQQHHPKTEAIIIFALQLMTTMIKQYSAATQKLPDSNEVKTEALLELDALLIEKTGPEDLPELIEKIKEIYHFKRCIFYEYIPWSNEFRGVMGDELQIVQNIRGKRNEKVAFFDYKKPIYLESPHFYIPEDLIEAYHLSSMIFVPIRYHDRIFGWLELDQIGTYFPYSQQLLNQLDNAGQRLAIFLSRKPQSVRVPSLEVLSEKEKAVLYLIVQGHSNKEIANILFLSEFTIRDYVQKLLTKLQAKNRTHLVYQAYQMGYLI